MCNNKIQIQQEIKFLYKMVLYYFHISKKINLSGKGYYDQCLINIKIIFHLLKYADYKHNKKYKKMTTRLIQLSEYQQNILGQRLNLKVIYPQFI